MEDGKQLVEAACSRKACKNLFQGGVHVVFNQFLELVEFHSGYLGELGGLGDNLLNQLLEGGGRHLHFLHILVEGGGEAENLIGGESGLHGDTAEPTCEVDHILLVGGAGLSQFVHGGTQR